MKSALALKTRAGHFGWDRTRTRAVGGGLPVSPFRLRGGFTIPTWPRFPKPPYHTGRTEFLRSGWKSWPFDGEPSRPRRGSSAGSHTPRHAWFTHFFVPFP